MSSGGKKLFLLGIIAIGIAILTSSISLTIYHVSGDIYLDRSRPGFLPEESEIEETIKENYKVSEYGPLDQNTIDEFIEKYDEQLDFIDSFQDSFSTEILSDESLGFTGE